MSLQPIKGTTSPEQKQSSNDLQPGNCALIGKWIIEKLPNTSKDGWAVLLGKICLIALACLACLLLAVPTVGLTVILPLYCLYQGANVEPQKRSLATLLVTQNQIEEQVKKGISWISETFEMAFETPRALHETYNNTTFLVVMSYNGMTTVAYPTTHPVDFEKLKKNAVAQFETMMRDPSHVGSQTIEKVMNAGTENSYTTRSLPSLTIEAYMFTRRSRVINGPREFTPYIWCIHKGFRQDLQMSKRNTIGLSGKIEDANLENWLNDEIPSTVPNKDTVIEYAAGAIHRPISFTDPDKITEITDD